MSWYYVDKNGNTEGPNSLEEMRQYFLQGEITPQSYVFNGADVNDWITLNKVGRLLKSCQDFKRSKQHRKKPQNSKYTTNKYSNRNSQTENNQDVIKQLTERVDRLEKMIYDLYNQNEELEKKFEKERDHIYVQYHRDQEEKDNMYQQVVEVIVDEYSQNKERTDQRHGRLEKKLNKLEKKLEELDQELKLFKKTMDTIQNDMQNQKYDFQQRLNGCENQLNIMKKFTGYQTYIKNTQLDVFTNNDEVKKYFCRYFTEKLIDFEYKLRLENSGLVNIKINKRTFNTHNSNTTARVLSFIGQFKFLPFVGTIIDKGEQVANKINDKYHQIGTNFYYANAMNFLWMFVRKKQLFIDVATEILTDIFFNGNHWTSVHNLIYRCRGNLRSNKVDIELKCNDLVEKLQQLIFFGVSNNCGKEDFEVVLAHISNLMRDTNQYGFDQAIKAAKNEKSGFFTTGFQEVKYTAEKTAKEAGRTIKKHVNTFTNGVKKVTNALSKFFRRS